MTPLLSKLAKGAQFHGATSIAPPELDNDACMATFIVSTPTLDNDGDIFVAEGCLPHMARYLSNPVVLWDHDDSGLPIAMSMNPATKACTWRVENDVVKASAWFHCMTQESSQIWQLVKAGILRGASIGCDPVPGKMEKISRNGTKFWEWIPLEWSVCALPVNPDALRDVMDAQWDGKSLAPSIIKSLKPYLPNDKGRKLFRGVKSRSWLSVHLPWVESIVRIKGKSMETDTTASDQVDKDVESPKEEGPKTPVGAQACLGFCTDLETALANLNEAVQVVENPDALSLLEEAGAATSDIIQRIRDGMKSAYPDLKVDATETPEEEVLDDTTKAKSIKKDMTTDDTTKHEWQQHHANITDAAELMDEMAMSPNIPKPYQRQIKGVCPGMKAACDYLGSGKHETMEEVKAEDNKETDKEEANNPKTESDADNAPAGEQDKPEDKKKEEKSVSMDDELDEADVKALKTLILDVKSLKTGLSSITGKVA